MEHKGLICVLKTGVNLFISGKTHDQKWPELTWLHVQT